MLMCKHARAQLELEAYTCKGGEGLAKIKTFVFSHKSYFGLDNGESIHEHTITWNGLKFMSTRDANVLAHTTTFFLQFVMKISNFTL